jgi:hypothetical protein
MLTPTSGRQVATATPLSCAAGQLVLVCIRVLCCFVLCCAVMWLQWDKEGFLQEVSAEHRLHHVDPSQIHDASKPVIPGDAQVVESPAKAVLQQISSGELPHLKHVQAPQ